MIGKAFAVESIVCQECGGTMMAVASSIPVVAIFLFHIGIPRNYFPESEAISFIAVNHRKGLVLYQAKCLRIDGLRWGE